MAMYYNLGECYYSQQLKEEQWDRGYELFAEGHYAAAVELFRRAATECHMPSECYLGYCHSHGLGVERNLFEALRWYGRNTLYSDWVKQDVRAVEEEIARLGLTDSREAVEFTDSEFGPIRVTFSARINYPQVRFNSTYTAVTLHTSSPYDAAVSAICKALVAADWRRQGYDYGRIDENFKIDYPLFSLRIARGQTERYSYRVEGSCYTIIAPQSVNFDAVYTREYIIDYGCKLLAKAAEEYLPRRIAEISKRTGLYYSRCRVVKTKKNLGTYYPNSGVVDFSYLLIKSSVEYVDTVILHELVHSLCGNHDKHFYDTMRHYGTERAVAIDKNAIGYNGYGEL